MFGKYHRANTKHSRDEVKSAVKRLKEIHPQSLLTVEELDAVVNIASMTDDDDKGLADEDEVRWFEYGDNEEAENDMVYLTTEDAKDLKETLYNTPFFHGMTRATALMAALSVMLKQLKNGTGSSFDGIRIDTAVNRRSVLGMDQNEAYRTEFELREMNRELGNRLG